MLELSVEIAVLVQYIIANLSITLKSKKRVKIKVLGGISYSVLAEILDILSNFGDGPKAQLLIKNV